MRSSSCGSVPSADGANGCEGESHERGPIVIVRARQGTVVRGIARRFLVVAILFGVVAGCASTARRQSPNYVPGASEKSLVSAGWMVTHQRGMQPLAGGQQLAYLVLVAPHGERITIQFLDSAARAMHELPLASRSMKSFHGVTLRNVLAFATPNGTRTIPDGLVSSLRSLLRQAPA